MLLKIEDCTYLCVYVDYLICTASVTTICIKMIIYNIIMKLYYYDHAWKVHTYNIMFFEKKGCHDKAIKIKLSCWQCEEVFDVPVDAKSEIILSTSGEEEDTFKFCSSIGCDKFMPLLVRSTLQGVSRPIQNS